MDAGRFYALLRFEEASLALRVAMRMGLVEQMGPRGFSRQELQHLLGLTEQAARTWFALLHVMEIFEVSKGQYRLTPMAAACLADGLPSSRKPYLAMGSGPEVDELIGLLRGHPSEETRPLYGSDEVPETIMDDPHFAREIAFGLASRARNFAEPLAAAIAKQVSEPQSLADIGAGSPYVALACQRAIRSLESVMLVDRANGMRFAREMLAEATQAPEGITFHEGDFFAGVPAADVYVLSNTAHDWRPDQYAVIAGHIRQVIPDHGLVCVHEPLLMTAWQSDAEWMKALWMACYALTLLRLTHGAGTCYTVEEHTAILASQGFEPLGRPQPTVDGCTALFYRVKG